MQRFTISLDDDLARQFDEFIARKGYVNRSEAVRDLIRSGLGEAALETMAPKGAATWCAASLSYVYDHRDQTVTARLLDVQHDHHDLVVSSLHTPLDHDHCLETVVLRGKTAPVRACADRIMALRGVRHGQLHLVPLEAAPQSRHFHDHSHGPAAAHVHLKPVY
jgi:CopG family transcriptional regulator, nickel-responsive regulator